MQMTKKIIMVGQASAKGAKGEPLAGASGRRLAALAGLDQAEMLKRFDWATVPHPDHVIGPDGKDAFDWSLARAAADKLRAGWTGRKVVMLGRNTAGTFKIWPADYEWFKPIEIDPGIEVAVIPYDNARSWWNDPAHVESARQFMLRINLGYLAFKRITPKREHGGRSEIFTPEQIAAALKASDGVDSYAAQVLADETGLGCTGETIRNYIAHYPELATVKRECREDGVDVAEHNVKRAIRAGDVETSRWLLRSKLAAGRGYELQVSGKLEHSGSIDHRHAIDPVVAKLDRDKLEALDGIYEVLAVDQPGEAAQMTGHEAPGPAISR